MGDNSAGRATLAGCSQPRRPRDPQCRNFRNSPPNRPKFERKGNGIAIEIRFRKLQTGLSKKKRRRGSRLEEFWDRRSRKPSPENATFLLDFGRVDSRDAHPEHGVAQAVLAAVSHVLSRRRRDTPKREPPSAAARILPFAHRHLLRSSPLSRARPIFLRSVRPSLVHPRRPDPVCRLTHSVSTRKSARNKRIQTHGPVRPSRSLSWPNAPFRGPGFARSAQLSGAWPSLPAQCPSSRLGQLTGPRPSGRKQVVATPSHVRPSRVPGKVDTPKPRCI
ncbi:hypothetical protein CRG98_030409 [Punica granatum]|uniref:Uncharacterized protein n=1 Tax=Punica granatum TaxID=22663 RepID=A0A2I0IYW7_PUNGR|nr:hypothetical protein CRG98_030409 [Punica granatum]